MCMSKNKATAELHEVPSDLLEALSAVPASKAAWQAISPLARNEWICWVCSAKRPETRMSRIERTCTDLLAGKRRPCCWPGCPHRKKL